MGKSIAVLGIGRFGKKLALSLSDMGAEVMVVDASTEVLEKMSPFVTYAIEADLKDVEALKGIGLEGMDAVVVAMGSDLTASIMSIMAANLTASIMSIMAAKEIGVPYVLAKAADVRMGSVLEKVGADKVIYPEEETGLRTARKLMSDSFLEFFEIDDKICILEMAPKKEWVGKNLIDLNIREKYRANVVAIREGGELKSFVDPKEPLKEDNELLVLVNKEDLKRFR